MSQVLFANNAKTTLAGAITNVSTSAALASGSGVLFPSPTTGQYFCMTFNDNATGFIYEIVHVTAVVGDTITMVRGQEGTTAQAWLAGDIAGNFWTAGSAQIMAQASDVQIQAGNYATDTSVSANTITATLSPAPVSYAAITGSPIRIKVANTTTSSTVNINLNGFGNKLAVLPNGSGPPSGSIVANSIIECDFNGTSFQVSTGVTQSSSNTYTEQTISTGATLTNSNTGVNYTCTASLTLVISQSTTLSTGWSNNVFALGGNVTISINAADAINNGTTGVGLVIPKGYRGNLTTDAAGQVFIAINPVILSYPALASTASADITSLGSQIGTLTGTNSVSNFGNNARAGQSWLLQATGASTLTNGTNLVVQGGASYACANGDWLLVNCVASGSPCTCAVSIFPVNGKPLPVAIATGGQVAAGTDNTSVITPLLLSTYSFTKSYDSGGQALTSGGALTLSHGMGKVPKTVTAFIKCTTSDQGYSPGDELNFVGVMAQNAETGTSIVSDSSNIYVKFNVGGGNPTLFVVNKSTGNMSDIVPANWQFIVRAYA